MNLVFLLILPIISGIGLASLTTFAPSEPEQKNEWAGMTVAEVKQLTNSEQVFIGYKEAGLFGGASYWTESDDYVIQESDLVRVTS
jgi:hypothetical protein